MKRPIAPVSISLEYLGKVVEVGFGKGGGILSEDGIRLFICLIRPDWLWDRIVPPLGSA